MIHEQATGRFVGIVLHAVLAIALSDPAHAVSVAQWDFDGTLDATTPHASLAPLAFAPAGTPSYAFEPALIGGRAAEVATFSRGTAFRVTHGMAANGDGTYLNQFTLIIDVMYPAGASGWQCLLQTSATNNNDADWCVQPDASGGGIGISGNYGGTVADGEWHRLALVVDLVAGSYISYINGVEAQRNEGLERDGRFALGPVFLLFADDNGETEGGFIDAVQFHDAALCPEDLAALGAPQDGRLEPRVPEEDCDTPAGTLRIKEGPYLQWVTPHAMTVMWETSLPADSVLSYNRAGTWTEVRDPEPLTIHEIRLEGLEPKELVEYFVTSTSEHGEVASETYAFDTAPPAPEPFTFAVWGDSQDNPSVFGGLVRNMRTHAPDFLVSVGDVVGTGSVYSQWGTQLLSPLFPLAAYTPFFVAIGNHEQNWHWFDDYMAQPGNEHWFSFDYAGSHFVILDTNYPFGPGSEQYAWLEEDLFSDAAQGADWLFTFHHHPPYSEIYEESIYARARMHLVPIYEAAGVDVNFTGHIHDYERGVFVPPDTGRRIAYIQTSGGGGLLWDDEFAGEWEEIELVIQYVYHYCLIDLTPETFRLRAINLQGNVIDEVTLTALPRDGTPPPPPPPPPAEAETQWDFTGGDLSADFGPGVLSYVGGDDGRTRLATSFGTTESFGIPDIGGEVAHVMRFPKAEDNGIGFRVDHGAGPNAGGTFVNEFTLAFDLYLPTSSFLSDGWLGLFNTNASNTNDSDAFVRLSDGGIGVSGEYHGTFRPERWHRAALVFATDGRATTLRKYLDGVEVGSQSAGEIDGRWSIYSRFDSTPWFYLLTDDSGDATTGYVSSVAFVDRAMSAAEIAALGAPDADGILSRPCGEDCESEFLRGDTTSDGERDITDGIYLLNFLFLGGAEPSCHDAADTDDSGGLDLSDAIGLFNFLFLGGPAPEGGAGCAADPTKDTLGCEVAGSCDL